jgi:hypothetical protein
VKAIFKMMTLTTLFLSFTGLAGAVHALTPSGEAKGKTCSQLTSECVSFNRSGGFDVSRCSDYKTSCMATGTYSDKKRTVTGVTKK